MSWTRFLHNASVKLVSLGVAILLFVFVSARETTSVEVEFLLEYRPAEGMMVTGDPPTHIYATMRGPGAVFRSLDPTELSTVVVDLTRRQDPGAMRYTVPTDSLQLPVGMKLVTFRPSEWDITLDRRVERDVPIMPDRTGAPAFGFEVVETRVEPAKVGVVGPGARLQQLEFVRTHSVDVTGREDDLDLDVELRLPPHPLQLQAKRARVRVEIREQSLERVVKGVEVVVEGLKDIHKADVPLQKLRLRGPRRLLEPLNAGVLRVVVSLLPGDVRQGGAFSKRASVIQGLPERVHLVGLAPLVRGRVVDAAKTP